MFLLGAFCGQTVTMKKIQEDKKEKIEIPDVVGTLGIPEAYLKYLDEETTSIVITSSSITYARSNGYAQTNMNGATFNPEIEMTGIKIRTYGIISEGPRLCSICDPRFESPAVSGVINIIIL